MNSADLAPLRAAADALFQRDQKAWAQIVQEERAIRSSLDKLDKAAAHSAEMTQSLACSVRAVGADAAWLIWIETQKNRLNVELARVMARKAGETDRIRRAFGRGEALRILESKQSCKGAW